MVAPDAEAPAQSTPENTGTFGKLKQTLSSSLLTAQDKGMYTSAHTNTFEIWDMCDAAAFTNFTG